MHSLATGHARHSPRNDDVHSVQGTTNTENRSAPSDLILGTENNGETEYGKRSPIHTRYIHTPAPRSVHSYTERLRGRSFTEVLHIELKLRRRFPRGVKYPGPFEE